jgi:hypothetical protein
MVKGRQGDRRFTSHRERARVSKRSTVPTKRHGPMMEEVSELLIKPAAVGSHLLRNVTAMSERERVR